MITLLQKMIPIPGFTDPFASITHYFGAVVFLFLSIAMIRRARGHAGRVSMALLMSFAIVFQLAMSGTYHLLDHDTTGRYVMRLMDLAAIFFLIASCLTFVHALLFRHFMRWGIILGVWLFTVTAITLNSVLADDVPEWLILSLYLGMGWLAVVSMVALYRRFGFRYIAPVLWGGVAYTVGAIADFARAPTLIEGVVGPHELFHVCVLIGLGFHWYFAYGIADARVNPLEVAPRTE